MPRKQTERKRRVHTRSRNGCVTCKAKHLRCDEQKPLCGRCLASGGNCGYVDRTVKNNSQSPQPSDGTLTPKTEDFDFWDEVFGTTQLTEQLPSGFAQTAAHDHSLLFDIFSRYRSVVDRDVSADSHAFLVEKALSNPALLHGALLLSALRWTWYSGSNETLHKSTAHHKLEAIKFVNERLQHPAVESEVTVASVAALAMAESGFDRPDAARVHLQGLSQVLATRVPIATENRSLLQNMISCTTQGLSRMSMNDVYNTAQSIEGCFTTLTLFIEPEIQSMSEDPSIWDQTLGEMISTKAYHQRTDHVAPRTEAESRARFLQCCLRIITMLGPDQLDFFTINWFVEALIDELSMSEAALVAGTFPRNAWLWAALMARVAATSVRYQNASESQQIHEWRRITDEKLRVASHASNLNSWAEVEALLRTWVWGGEDARLLKDIWEGAVLGSRRQIGVGGGGVGGDDTIAPAFLDKRLFYSDEEKKPVIVDDEAFDLCISNPWG